jgi:hypothetical protein
MRRQRHFCPAISSAGGRVHQAFATNDESAGVGLSASPCWKRTFPASLIASAAHTELWRMPKTLLFVGFLYDFTKSFASLGFSL